MRFINYLLIAVLLTGCISVFGQDYSNKSVQELLPLAEKGDAKAQYRLGLTYSNDIDVPQDFQEAAKWYRLAAEQGHAYAQYNLGVMYKDGEGVSQDYVLAHKWFNLAADQGLKPPAKGRDDLARNMITSQVQKAQRLAREFKPNKEKPKKESQ